MGNHNMDNFGINSYGINLKWNHENTTKSIILLIKLYYR